MHVRKKKSWIILHSWTKCLNIQTTATGGSDPALVCAHVDITVPESLRDAGKNAIKGQVSIKKKKVCMLALK